MRAGGAAGLGAVLADAGVDPVVGHGFCGQHHLRPGVALVITLLLPLPVVPVEGRVHPLSLMRLIVLVA